MKTFFRKNKLNLFAFFLYLFLFSFCAEQTLACTGASWRRATAGCGENQQPALGKGYCASILPNFEKKDDDICCCDKSVAPSNEEDSVGPINFIPQVSIPSSEFQVGSGVLAGTKKTVNSAAGDTQYMETDLLPKYIKAIYNYGLAIAGILAAIILMGGGILWLISSGDSSKITQAKELIIGSISGLVILFSAYLILNTVNPALVAFQPIKTKIIYEQKYLVCCSPAAGETKVAIQVVDGKNIAIEGDDKGKEVSCGGDEECGAGTVCIKKSSQGQFACEVDSFCCDCGKGSITGYEKFYWTCKNNLTQAGCSNWCYSWYDSLLGTGGLTYLLTGLGGNANIEYFQDASKYTCTGAAYTSCKAKK